jgi:hypothetical protein
MWDEFDEFDKIMSEEKEPDWKEIAIQLHRRLQFAASSLRATGSGMMAKGGEMIHYLDYLMDGLDMFPGFECDREIAHAKLLPAREQRGAILRIMKERKKHDQPNQLARIVVKDEGHRPN